MFAIIEFKKLHFPEDYASGKDAFGGNYTLIIRPMLLAKNSYITPIHLKTKYSISNTQ